MSVWITLDIVEYTEENQIDKGLSVKKALLNFIEKSSAKFYQKCVHIHNRKFNINRS